MRVAALILAMSVVLGIGRQTPLEQFAPHRFVAKDGTALPYRLLEPMTLDSGKRYPLVLQLHGSGAIGTDNEGQIGAFSNGWLQPEIRKRYPAYVLVPQFPARTVEYPAVANESQLRSHPTLLTSAYELVDFIAKEFPVDRSRIYVVGFSMGASSALQAIIAHPDWFAAAMAIAPVPPDASTIPATPILILHGDRDTENPFTVSRAWSDEITRRGARNIEFRAYPGLEHELPPDVPAGTWWRDWLFSKRRTP
jgi:predicted peptidase